MLGHRVPDPTQARAPPPAVLDTGPPPPAPRGPDPTALVLPQLFQKHVDTYGLGYDPIEFICGPFYSIRLLARRFALTLGFDRARDAAHLIHRCVLGRGCSDNAPACTPLLV